MYCGTRVAEFALKSTFAYWSAKKAASFWNLELLACPTWPRTNFGRIKAAQNELNSDNNFLLPTSLT